MNLLRSMTGTTIVKPKDPWYMSMSSDVIKYFFGLIDADLAKEGSSIVNKQDLSSFFGQFGKSQEKQVKLIFAVGMFSGVMYAIKTMAEIYSPVKKEPLQNENIRQRIWKILFPE